MGVAGSADYAQKPALHEGRGMVAGLSINVRKPARFPSDGEENRPAGRGSPYGRPGLRGDAAPLDPAHRAYWRRARRAVTFGSSDDARARVGMLGNVMGYQAFSKRLHMTQP